MSYFLLNAIEQDVVVNSCIIQSFNVESIQNRNKGKTKTPRTQLKVEKKRKTPLTRKSKWKKNNL